MSLLSLLVVLLLEQFYPLPPRFQLVRWVDGYIVFLERNFNAGEARQGVIAWWLAILPPTGGAVVLFYALAGVHAVLAWIFCILVLYLTTGFRQFSHHYTVIHRLLREEKVEEAQMRLGEWIGQSCHQLSAGEVARLSIEQALIHAHRNVYGVLFWFVVGMLLGMGPAGALLYRMALLLSERWGTAQVTGFGAYARHAAQVIEWLPLRLTAATFAIVGDFEDTVYCWRNQAASWPEAEVGIVLASGAGSLGVKLGQAIMLGGNRLDRPEIGVEAEVDIDDMQSAVGLAWRALLFQLGLLLLLSLANLSGSGT